MLRANMALADSTDESADDMTAAETAPSPMNVTHDGHRYCITIGRIILSSSGVIGIRCRGRSVFVQSARQTADHGAYGIMKLIFQDFPGPFTAIFHVFPVPFNGMDIERVRLSHTYAHVAFNVEYLTPSSILH